MNRKKAAGHVEAILSLAIFIGFLIFLLFIFNPLKLISNSTLVDSVLINMEENLGVIVNSLSVSLSDGPGGAIEQIGEASCFEITGFTQVLEDMDCSGSEGKKKILARDKDNNLKLDSWVNSKNPKKVQVEFTGGKFYTIVCSDSFEESTLPLSGCVSLNDGEPTDYKLGIISEKNIWSREKIDQLKLDYENRYAEIKDVYVSSGSDFAFKLWSLDDPSSLPELEAGIPPRGTRVDSKTTPIDVIDRNGNLDRMTITILTW